MSFRIAPWMALAVVIRDNNACLGKVIRAAEIKVE